MGRRRGRGHMTTSNKAGADISVIILTRDEAIHIERAIASVKPIAARIIVVDSGSTDDTIDIARRAGADIFHHPWVNYATQFQWALDHCGITTAWVMRLDADEVIGADLAARIATELPNVPADVTGITFNLGHIFMGRWIRHGGRYPLVLLRLWRTGAGRMEARWMDEHVIIDRGRLLNMPGTMFDHNLKDVSFFIDKHNRYATREAIDKLNSLYDLGLDSSSPVGSSSRQASVKRWIKQHIYNHLPLGFGPFCYFIYRMIFRLGILDGQAGLIYHFLQGFWYRFLVDVKVAELVAGMTKAGCQTADDRRHVLTNLTGHKLGPADRSHDPA